MTSNCKGCGSLWPADCPCAKLANHISKSKVRDEAGYPRELACRLILANGMPPNGRSCDYHQSMIRDLARDIQDPGMRAKPRMAAAQGVFEESITDQSALLPMCNQCGIEAGVLSGTLSAPSVVGSVDTCTCASEIVSVAECSFCEVMRVEASKQLALQTRTIQGTTELGCECGNLVMQDIVRKCTGCGGHKTAPYVNFAGFALIFKANSAQLNGEGRPPATRTAPQALAAALPPLPSPEEVPKIKGSVQKTNSSSEKRKRGADQRDAGQPRKHQQADVVSSAVTAEYIEDDRYYARATGGVAQGVQTEADDEMHDLEARVHQQLSGYLSSSSSSNGSVGSNMAKHW